MIQLPVGFGPIPDPNAFGSAFVPDLGYGLAAGLAIAAVTLLALLPFALRRREPGRPAIVHEPIALPEAA